MNMYKKHHESGQALVLVVFIIFALIGVSAFALDGGLLLHERRRAQNASDAAALAAALAKIQGTSWQTAAIWALTNNDFVVTTKNCHPGGPDCIAGTGEKWTIEVSNPPRSGEYAGMPNYILVEITTNVDSNFAHLVYGGVLETTVVAVSRIWPSQSLTPGYALYGASKHDCKTVWFTGTGDTEISGGSVFSNSDAASASCQSGVQDGGGNVTVDPPDEIKSVGWFDTGGSGSVSPSPTTGVDQETMRPIPQPDCSGLPDHGKVKVNAGHSDTLLPGMYEEITVNSGTATLLPGMYCIYGNKGFSGTGGTVNGTGIFIYLIDGPFDLGGSTTVNLFAEDTPGVLVDPSQNDWKGMLVYADPSNTNDIEITGGTGSTYTGSIIGLNNDCIVSGGGTSIGLNSQIICDTVKITGNALVVINYNEGDNFALPPAIDLAR